MKFNVSSGELSSHLQSAAKAISGKSASVIPALGKILFDIQGDLLTITGADMSTRISSTLTIQNQDKSGSFMVLKDTILNPLKELADQPITIEIDEANYKATLTYSNGHYSFGVEPADAYPATMELGEASKSITIPAKIVLQGLNRTRFATGTDERRPIMSGIYFDFLTDGLVFVATDGRILVRHIDQHIKVEEETSFCLPSSASDLLVNTYLSKETADVEISYDDKYIRFEMPSVILVTRRLEGNYPRYSSVIPESSPILLTVDREDLLSASRRVANFSNKASNLIQFNITADNIHITASDLDFSVAAEENVSCSSNDAQTSLRIGFDHTLLQNILKNLSSEQITLALADQTRAVLITPNEAEEGIDVNCLIVPLKTIGE